MNFDTAERLTAAPILWFIAITFTATFGIEVWLIQNKISFGDVAIQSSPALWLLAIMWIPGLTALLVSLFMEKTGIRGLKNALSLRIGSLGPYFLTLFIAPAVYAAMYGLSWAFGLTEPDLSMAALTAAIGSDEPVTRETVFQVMLPLSIFLGPFINFVFGLGEELGWRGFLLPRLMPLGKIPAYLVLGILWGLWHAPLIWAGFNYPGHPVAGIAMMCVLSTAFGLFINEMTLHYRSSLLAAFIHGAVNAQGYGIWAWLFPGTAPLLGGGTGIIAAAIWLATGILTICILSRFRSKNT
ncbi:type II CAAX prenyl endopeptidase Rce1 family protein [uncultured Pseudodesulfovibrio sp.]|uniref:CPBP family intramembrane glutamic endopeptidase n=1 Tax=uncultured Pseudodesulfovibrio sp. TaxID=2035858 RepID=UPI0029C7DC13|nr:CPBP family glutamic-type intramembrane protease [uncultured Pseudodesulfovibrio sp.]